jgi:hypothetical protein
MERRIEALEARVVKLEKKAKPKKKAAPRKKK